MDLRAQHDELRPEIEATIEDIIDHSSFVGGSYVEAFEREFADYCRARFAIGCGSGTDALKLALQATGVGPGDLVVTCPFTFIGTVEAISMVGASPVFVDIDLATYTLSVEKLEEYVSDSCRLDSAGRLTDQSSGRPVVAILPVHLYGLPADMEPINALAQRHGLIVVEDACQAHGAIYLQDGVERPVGTLGDVAAFSFYPGKNLGALGEAGATTTDDRDKAERMKMLRDHGQIRKYIHTTPDGWNSRLDSLQAGVLEIKLRKLDEWNRRRRERAAMYHSRLAGHDLITLPFEPSYARHVYHLFVVRVSDQDRVKQELAERGIQTGLHYPVPLHLQQAYADLGHREGSFPNSEIAARTVLSLPMYPHLSESQIELVCDSLVEGVELVAAGG